jgi:hypothetical protein
VGGFEFDEYDFDVNPMTATHFWNSYTVYKLGFSAAWTTPSEQSTFAFQVAMDQDNAGPAFALRWTGEYGPWSTNYSVLTAKEYDHTTGRDTYLRPIFSIGNRLNFGGFTATVDYMNRCGDPYWVQAAVKGHTVSANFQYEIGDHWDLSLKGVANIAHDPAPYGWDKDTDSCVVPEDYTPSDVPFDKYAFYSGGLTASWYPLQDKSLRVQASAGYNNNMLFGLLGITYDWAIKLW